MKSNFDEIIEKQYQLRIEQDIAKIEYLQQRIAELESQRVQIASDAIDHMYVEMDIDNTFGDTKEYWNKKAASYLSQFQSDKK